MKRNVRPDLTDLRDAYYRASIRPLKSNFISPALLVSAENPALGLRIPIRNQGKEGSCTGQALASLADMMRDSNPATAETPAKWMASARMLLEMSKHQEPMSNPTGIHSLRSALKGFYHNGVCTDQTWPYAPNLDRGSLTAGRSEEAKRIGLGAYYRLRPLLDDYHAGLNETGCIYTAAKLHQGWQRDKLVDGRILNAGQGDDDDEGHAFLIVGYDMSGFLILNSWGSDWGLFKGIPGVAHWSYKDWADSIMDAWIARLSVPTPDAFDIAIYQQGLQFSMEPISATSSPAVLAQHKATNGAPGSTPRANLLGHYAHFEDGAHMPRGPYPSERSVVNETATILSDAENREKYDHLLLWIEGGTEPIEELVRLAVAAKAGWLRDRVYPYYVFWCADFAKESHDVLATLFERAKQRGGERGEDLDVIIEETVRGIGRAFWRDIKRSAGKATAEPRNDGRHLFDVFASLCRDKGYKLHVVAEGAGALLIGELVRCAKHARTLSVLADAIASLSLIAPPVRIDELERCICPLTKKLADRKRDVTVYVPSKPLEGRMRVGPYGRSILHLVANAFEDAVDGGARPPSGWPEGLRGPPLLGMSPQSSGLADKIQSDCFYGMRVYEVSEDDGRTEALGMSSMRRNPEIDRRIWGQIVGPAKNP